MNPVPIMAIPAEYLVPLVTTIPFLQFAIVEKTKAKNPAKT